MASNSIGTKADLLEIIINTEDMSAPHGITKNTLRELGVTVTSVGKMKDIHYWRKVFCNCNKQIEDAVSRCDQDDYEYNSHHRNDQVKRIATELNINV